MCDNYVHLHHHGDASGDGMSTIDVHLDYIKSIGQTAIALTDHGTASGLATFSLYGHQIGIKPIMGIEIYIDYADKIGHLTVLSSGITGYNNLIRLNNASHCNLLSYGRGAKRPAVTMDMLDAYRHGLIILTGCPASPIHYGEIADGLSFTRKLHHVFGDNLWAELMFPLGGQDFHSRPLAIANELGLQPVITNDAHFVTKADGAIHNLLVSARKGFDYESKQLWLKSRSEIEQTARAFGISEDIIKTGCDNTVIIADSIEPVTLKAEPVLPHVSESDIDELTQKIYQALDADTVLHPDTAEERRKRLAFELSVFRDFDIMGYLYITHDIVSACKDKNILYTTRGSAAGSYILYLLDISKIDPIHFGLLFERFLNVARKDLPDVDLDVDALRRGDVIDYARERWGMMPVSTVTTYSHASIVRDINRVMNLNLAKDIIDEITASDYGSEAWHKFANISPKIEPLYAAINGQERNKSRHAAAIAAVPKDLPFEIPIESQANGELAIAFTEGSTKTLQALGVVKFDLLGIRVLSKIAEMRDLTGDTLPIRIPVTDLPQEIYTLFSKGEVDGLFQFTSPGMLKLAKNIDVENVFEIGLCSALYRPGALDAGLHTLYGDVKHGRAPKRTIHPNIDKILEPTHSVICYQEQMMAVFAAITGGGLASANVARKVLSPKSVKKLQDPEWIASRDKVKTTFFADGRNNGYDDSILNQVWDELETHTRYSFNKSHSDSYAALAAIMLYYKYYYPQEYYTAMLRIDLFSPQSNAKEYIYHAVRAGCTIGMPDINVSTHTYELRNNKINLPLSAIKGFGQKTLDNFLAIRSEYGQFDTLEELRKAVPASVLNKRHIENLRRLGGLSLSDVENGTPDDDTMVELLGYTLPKKWQVDKVEAFKDHTDRRVGWISEIQSRISRAGNRLTSIVLEPYWLSNWRMEKDPYPLAVTAGQFIGIVIDPEYHKLRLILPEDKLKPTV